MLYLCTASFDVNSDGNGVFTIKGVPGNKLVEGDQIRFRPPVTTIVGGMYALVGGAAYTITSYSGQHLGFFDLHEDKPVYLDFSEGRDGRPSLLTMTNAVQSWGESQCLAGSLVPCGGIIGDLDSTTNDRTLYISSGLIGQAGALLRNPDGGGFRMCRMNNLTQALYGSTAIVDGVPGQSLKASREGVFHYIFAGNRSSKQNDIQFNFIPVTPDRPTQSYPIGNQVGHQIMNGDPSWTHIGSLVSVISGLRGQKEHPNIGSSPFNPVQRAVSSYGFDFLIPRQNQRLEDAAHQGDPFETASAEWVDTPVRALVCVTAVSNLPVIWSTIRYETDVPGASAWLRTKVKVFGITRGKMEVGEVYSIDGAGSGPKATFSVPYGAGWADGFAIATPQVYQEYPAGMTPELREMWAKRPAKFTVGILMDR